MYFSMLTYLSYSFNCKLYFILMHRSDIFKVKYTCITRSRITIFHLKIDHTEIMSN